MQLRGAICPRSRILNSKADNFRTQKMAVSHESQSESVSRPSISSISICSQPPTPVPSCCPYRRPNVP